MEPTVTDWLMLAVTVIYVVATIVISVFNGRSAKATKEQVEESRRQFEETKRLELMPFLQVEIPPEIGKPCFVIELPCTDVDNNQDIYSIVYVKNIGNGSATNILYSWEIKETKKTINGYPPINAIMSGDGYCFQITLFIDDEIEFDEIGVLTWQYDDLLGRSYEQKVTLIIEEGELVRVENNAPKYLGNVVYKKK